MTAKFPAPAWLVGCGNMAGAMVEGWRAAGVDFADVTVIRPSGTRVDAIRTVMSYPDEAPRFVMLGFKPQKLAEVVPALAPHIGSGTVLVSMLAGVKAATLRDRFPDARAVVRVMPNLPVAQRAGVAALYSDDGDWEARDAVGSLMALLGLAPWCADEKQFAAIGSVAGAGPAYVARFAEALTRGGERLGLDSELAEAVAVQTLIGTGSLAAATGESMKTIARRVASPKGTTEQGLAVLDAPDGLQPLVDRMLDAAFRRAEELAAEAAVIDGPQGLA
jgi:pyrroline-5-carboxylate reductase